MVVVVMGYVPPNRGERFHLRAWSRGEEEGDDGDRFIVGDGDEEEEGRRGEESGVWEGRSCSGVRETQPGLDGGGGGRGVVVVVVGAPPPPAHAIYTLGQGTGKATTVPCSLFLQVFPLLSRYRPFLV